MPEEPLKPVGKITFNDGNRQTNMPVGSITFDDVTDMSKFVAPKDNNIEPVIEELSRTAKGLVGEAEKQYLREILTNPNVTGEQAKRGIATLQGYDKKQDYEKIAELEKSTPRYYMRVEDNGVLMPQALGYGERPPSGYDVSRTFSSPKDASDDSWYTDVSKSIANGALSALQGATSLVQQGYMAITDEESKYLNELRNQFDSSKIYKDENLNARFVKGENIKEAKDFLNIDNYDISPKTIWGTLNAATESIISMVGPAGLAKAIGAGGKLAAFVGSYISQLGNNLDANKDAGLSDREASGLTAFQTGIMAVLDAVGLEGVAFSNATKEARKQLVKNLTKETLKNADGTIAKEAMSEMISKIPIEYAKMAKVGAKEIGKGASIESVTEGGQEFVRKASEALWDKMSEDDKAKFGTDISSPGAFADYIESTMQGFVGAGPLSLATINYKQKYNEQSTNVFNKIKQGPEAVNELKANLNLAKDRGELTEQEYNQAMFKVDAYSNYNEQTKDLDLNDEQKKEAFELSFNIDALKSEIPTSKEDVDKLDPIAQAKINSKKELMKGLQKKLDEIILNNQVKKETKVDEKTADKTIPKEEGQTGKSLEELLKEYGKTDVGAKEVDVEGILSEEKKRAKITDNAPIDWNTKLTSLQRKQIVQEHLKSTTKNEMPVNLQQWENGKITAVIDGEGRRMDLAQSAPSNTGETKDYLNRKALPEFTDELSDPNGVKYKKASEPVMMKRVDIDAFNYENDTPDLDNDGNQKRKGILVLYNPKSGEYIGNIRELDKIGNYKYTPSRYSPSEVAQMDSLKKINFNTDEINPFLYRPKPEKASGKTAPTKAQNDSEMGQNLQDVNVKPTKEAGVQRELTPEEKELKAAAKPEIKLDYIKDEKILDKDVKTTIETASGESMNVLEKAKKAQSRIKKNMKLLEEVLNCLHG